MSATHATEWSGRNLRTANILFSNDTEINYANPTVRSYNRYTYRLDTMDAQSSVPTTITRPKRFLSNL